MKALHRLRRGVSIAWVSAALAACGGGGSGSGGGSAGDTQPDYFPLSVGNVWYFSNPSTGTTTSRVTQMVSVGGESAFVVQDSDASGSTESYYAKRDTGIWNVPLPTADALEVALSSIPVLPLPVVVGQTRTWLSNVAVSVPDLDRDGQPEAALISATQTVVGLETLNTPAGTMAQTAHVRIVITELVTLTTTGVTVTLTQTQDTWFAPGIGPVRNDLTVAANGLSSTDSDVLQAYGVGTRRSDAIAPTITSRTPSIGATASFSGITVVFSEAMDRHADPTSLLSLSGPSGIISGALSWSNDRSLTFTPSGTLDAGTYTVTLSATVQDLVGNGLASGSTWTFTLDRSGPVVVSATPPNGSTEVALTTDILFDFDEVPATGSVNGSNVQLTSLGLPVPASVSLSGKTVTIHPLQPLQRSTRYDVTVSGVSDPLGNALTPLIATSFITDTGRLAPVEALPDTANWTSRPSVAADLQSDGLVDLVGIALNATGAPGVRLVTYRQLPGSTWSMPTDVPIQTSCSATGFGGAAAADINNDNRMDLVVVLPCAIEVQEQTSSGNLQTVASIPTTNTASVVYGVRTSGLPALAAMRTISGGSGVDAVQIWPQSLPNQFNAATVVNPTMLSPYWLNVGDVNGDGLDDLIIWGVLSGGASHGFEIHLQRSDGSFGAGVELSAPGCSSFHSLRDVNGDGRPDIVFNASCSGVTQVGIMIQAPNGSFSSPTLLSTAANASSISVADMDGDGRQDLIVLHESYGVGLYLQRPDGTFSPETIYVASNTSAPMLVADVTGDGRLDVITSVGVMRQKNVAVGAASANKGSRSSLLRSFVTGSASAPTTLKRQAIAH